MINFNFSLKNPFGDTWRFLLSKNGRLGKNKAWEANIYSTSYVFNINFQLSFRGDHAGLYIGGGLFGIEGEFNCYDTRHWDYENDCWTQK